MIAMSGDSIEGRYHFFLSYRGGNLPLARSVYEILTGPAGYRVCFQAEHFKLGDVVPADITRAVKNSDRVLALVTPAYFDGSFWTAVPEFWTAAEAGKLVVLRFGGAELPLAQSLINYQDCPSDPGDPLFVPTVLAAGRLQPTPASSFRRISGLGANLPSWKGESHELVGRKAELQLLHDTLGNNTCSVICVIAGGGYGKSSLVRTWLDQVRNTPGPDDYHGIKTGFTYSFYKQGSEPMSAVSSTDFFEEAVSEVCGVERIVATQSGSTLREQLIRDLRGRRFIMVLDGLEPHQVPQGSDRAGAILEETLDRFVHQLPDLSGAGLTVITSRVLPAAFKGQPIASGRVRVINLQLLDEAASVEVLCGGGMSLNDPRTAQLARETNGHPLLLALLGPAVSRGDYDVESFAAHRVLIGNKDNDVPATVANFVNSYMMRLSPDPERAAQAAAVLRAACMFDRPIPFTVLRDQLLERARIDGLTSELWYSQGGGRKQFSETRFKAGCDLLRTAALLTVSSATTNGGPPGKDPETWRLEVHPLIQAGVRGGLIANHLALWRQAHWTIYKCINFSVPLLHRKMRKPEGDKLNPYSQELFQKAEKEDQLAERKELQTIYSAVSHGVHAGRGKLAGWVYALRCLHGFRGYSTNQFGMIREDVAAMSHYFIGSWDAVRDDIGLNDTAKVQAYVWSGVLLIGINRGDEGRRLMLKGLQLAERTGHYVTAARTARNLALAHAIAGQLDESLDLADRAVALMGRRPSLWLWATEWLLIRRSFMRMAVHANRGAILHYRGDLAAARKAFDAAERVQASTTKYPTLRTLWCFHLAQFLIDTGQFDEADGRIAAALIDPTEPRGWGEGVFAKPVLQMAYSRSRIRRVDMTGVRRDWATVQRYAEEFREFGRDGYRLRMDWLVPTFLTTLAGVARLSADLGRAEAHLEEARKFADRGSAKLFEPDLAIEEARVLAARGRGTEARARLAMLRADCRLLAPRAGEIEALENGLP